MPRKVRKKIGDIYEEHTVETFGDKVKEFLQGVAGLAIIGGIIFLFIT